MSNNIQQLDRFTKRIKEIIPHLKRVAMRDFSHQIKIDPSDNSEISKLEETVNIMTESLKEMDEEIKYKTSILSSTKKDLELQIKRIREELKESHKQLLVMFEGMDEVMYVADPETHELLYMNKVAKKYWGDGIGKKCHQVLQKDNKPCEFCSNNKIFGENLGKVFIWEFQNKINNKWYRCTDRAIKWPDGRWVRFEIAIDITDIKQMSEHTKHSEQRFRQLFNSMKSGVVVYNVKEGDKFYIKDINHAAEKIENVKKDEVIGKEISEIFPGVVNMGIINLFKKVYQIGKPIISPNLKYKNNKGIISYRENYIYKLPNDDIVAIYDDITDKIKTENELFVKIEELERLNKAMVGRELKMIELKQENDKLKKKII